jgi:C4-dicarboxylate-specific signal transduction histidine kinase
MTAIIYFLTSNFGVIERNFSTNNIVVLGSALEMIFFAFALARKFNFEIETEFNARTVAESKLKEINENLETLVETKSQELISSKKKVALGEMAAGVAHEINTPLSVLDLNLARIETLVNKDNLDKDSKSLNLL